jgi:hypothetical protein
MAIGLAIARRKSLSRDDRATLWRETLARTLEFTRQFEQRFGALDCRTLVGLDLDFTGAESVQAFRASGASERVCIPAVRFAVAAATNLALT